MKKIFIIFTLLCLSLKFQAQIINKAPKDYTITMDSLLQFVNKQEAKTGILYDRVVANANLVEFNDTKSKKQSDYWHFVQAWGEIYRASYNPTKQPSHEIIDQTYNRNDNVIDIGIINTNINYLDYGTKENPNINFKDVFIREIANKNPFKEKRITIVACLKENISSQKAKFRLNPNYIYQDETNRIKNLTMIVEDKSFKIINNFENLAETIEHQFQKSNPEMVINFKVEYADNQIQNVSSKLSVNVNQIIVNNNSGCNLLIEDFVNQSGVNQGITANSLENTIPFQGYNETIATKGVLEYRTYYSTLTNNCKLQKPVIILDGFDPGDKRKIHKNSLGYIAKSESLYELMVFDPDNNVLTENNLNFIDDILSPQGFDVTLVNFPNGADYVERNAMALVALLKRENEKLRVNGSNEQITLVGPSMGGLVSRYALAYMEKNNIPHNVKLWVSFDSPHLGANIPIAAQENIYFFGHDGQKEEAKKKFHENFASPAARQMLIEQLDGNHENYNWWQNPYLFAGNNGQNNKSPFRTQFISKLENNGLPNSKGFPTNVRKIALINGTTKGTKTNSEGQLVLELAGFKPSWLKVASIQNRNMASFGNWSQTFDGIVTYTVNRPAPLTPWWTVTTPVINYLTNNRQNTNPRGCMDVVQGGTYDTNGIIKEDFTPGLIAAGVSFEWRNYTPNHCFIPTVSSLALKNPNFDWSIPLNRNLVCDPANKETPFDTYFSPSKNEEHVALSQESVDWLLKEFKGVQQVPRFNVNESELVGQTVVCENQVLNYSFNSDLCRLPSGVRSWSTNNKLQIISSTNTGATVKGIANGSATLTATFQNGQTVTKNIWVGLPTFNISRGTYQSETCDGVKYHYVPFIINLPPDTSLTFHFLYPNVRYTTIGNVYNFEFLKNYSGSFNIYATATNICGTFYYESEGEHQIGNCASLNNSGGNKSELNNVSSLFKTYPNPTNYLVNIELKNQDEKPENNSTIFAELYNMIGEVKRNVTVNNNIATVDVLGLPRGIYILKINIDGIIESHQVAIE